MEKKPPVKYQSLSDILGQVENIEKRTPPTLGYFLGLDGYFSELKDALKVIAEYKHRDKVWDPNQMVSDALYLEAIHASLSEMVGYVQSMSSRAENVRKVTKSQYILSIKETRDNLYKDNGIFTKLTEKEVDDASRVLCKEEAYEARDAESISRILSNGWYAIGDFCRTLSAAIYRTSREEMLSRKIS
jgi:hypothetical protein